MSINPYRGIKMPELIVVSDNKGLADILTYLEDKEFVAFDTETTGLTQQDRIVGISVCASEDKAYYLITHGNIVNSDLLTETLKTKQLIAHNSVFDCMIVEANYKISLIENIHTDTLMLAHLINENRRVGLKELAKEYYGEDSTLEAEEVKASIIANGGKYTAKEKEFYKADPHLLGKYGAKDAWLTYKLFMDMVPELEEQGLTDFFYNQESMPLLRGPTYQLNTTGIQVDTAKLNSLKAALIAECEETKAFIYQEIAPHIKEKYPGTNKKNTFSIGSNQQLSWLLFGQLGLEFSVLTKGGRIMAKYLGIDCYTKSGKRQFISQCENPFKYIGVDKRSLDKLASKYKWIEALLVYKQKLKLLNTYVEGIEERIQYGIIRPSYLQHGTTGGRYASRNPNFQNLPRDDKRIKSCLISRPGRVFVGADYSQLEPRIFAYVSGDRRLLEAFNGKSDFYSVVGMEVYGKTDCLPMKDGHPNAFGKLYSKLRQDSKVFTLASTYGATGSQLGPLMGKSRNDAQADIDRYFDTFPAVRAMMENSHKQVRETGIVYSLFGRPRRIPEAMKLYDIPYSDLPYAKRSILNLSVNHRIQSSAASIVNRASIRFYEYCKENDLDCKIVSQVHDSLVVECAEDDADMVSVLLRDAMESTNQLEGIALEALPKIGKNLAEV